MATSDSNGSPTVVFDLGGKTYKVSRSLLEQYPDTMLARMVSEAWKKPGQNPEDPHFIERDGERFKYVLDFMRDGGSVSLPLTVSKDELIKDLEYFGFDATDFTSIRYDSVGAMEPKTIYKRLEEKYSKKQSEVRKKEEEVKMELECMQLAHFCYLELKRTGDTLFTWNWYFKVPTNHLAYNTYKEHSAELSITALRTCKGNNDYANCFQSKLGELFGLKYTEPRYSKDFYHGSFKLSSI